METKWKKTQHIKEFIVLAINDKSQQDKISRLLDVLRKRCDSVDMMGFETFLAKIKK